jgi:hypothetical protein
MLAASGVQVAVANPAYPTLAQEPESEQQDEGDTAEETGAEEGQTEGTEATGPPWTYQMARAGLLLLLVLVLGIGLAYYRFVLKRQRGEV